tara:strand:- start:6943 stop:10434 length:3492 start_codon:yes stop_codon:yes gene_type:complete
LNFKNIFAILFAVLFLVSFAASAHADVITVTESIPGRNYELDHSFLDNDPVSQSITAYCPDNYEIVTGNCESDYLRSFGSLREDIDSFADSVTCTYRIDFPWACGDAFQIVCPYIEATAVCESDGTNGGSETNNPPTLFGLPNVSVEENSGLNSDLIDLWDYVDDEDFDYEINFRILAESNSGLVDCIIENNRYLSCSVERSDLGSSAVTIEAEDTYGATDIDSFTVSVTSDNDDPNLSGIPTVYVAENDGFQDNVIDLHNYVFDNQDSDSELDFDITNQTNTGLIFCEIDQDRYIDCDDPATDQTGTNTITVRVTDTDGATDTDSFRVEVIADDTNEAPVLSGIPNVDLDENDGAQDNLIDLYAYAFDNEDSESELTFDIIANSDSGLIYCDIDQDRYIDCDPPRFDSSGSNTITVEVTDTDGLSDTDSFIIIVNDIFDDPNDTPTISGLPNLSIEENAGARNNWIDLHSYAFDQEDSDSELDFRISNQNNTSLIFCSIDQDRYFECEAPRDDYTGTSTITIEVEDQQGATDSDTFTIEVVAQDSGVCSDIDIDTRTIFIDEDDSETIRFDIRNLGDDDFRLFDVDVDVTNNSSFLDARDTDFDTFIREDGEGEVEIRLESFNVSSDREATVRVRIRGEFDNGNSCSFSDIEESFRVWIDNEGSSGSGSGSNSCSDIDFKQRTVSMDESDRETFRFDVENNGNDDFRITDVDVTETSSYLSIVDFDDRGTIRDNDELALEIELRSNNVSSDRTATVYVDLRGEFDDGRSCSFSQIGRESFRVEIENSGSGSSNICNDIEIDASDVTIAEDSSRTKIIRIKNENNRSFDVDNITVSESNSYFNISIRDEPERISANDEEELEIRIYTNNVSRDKSGDVEIRVSGEFSNGVNCSSSRITEEFRVTVDNRGSGSSDDDDRDDEDFDGSVKIDFSNNFAILEEGQTKNINVTIKNGLDNRQCFDLSSNDTPVFSTSLSSTEICVSENGSETISMSITGRNSGTDNVRFEAEYDGISKIKFVSVEVLGDEIIGERPRISVPDDSEELFRDNEIIITNTGPELRNVTIRALNAPEGVNIEEVQLSRWEPGETLGIEVDIEPGFDDVVSITLSISSDSGSIGVPVEFKASEGQGFTGLVGLATTAGMAIGLIILIVLAILGILSVFSRK